MANLLDLITKEEADSIQQQSIFKIGPYNASVFEDIRSLTVQQLSDIALILIKTEYGEKCPECILPAKAIEILITRAEKKNIAVF